MYLHLMCFDSSKEGAEKDDWVKVHLLGLNDKGDPVMQVMFFPQELCNQLEKLSVSMSEFLKKGR